MLEITGLTAGYRSSVPVVRGISLHVEPGAAKGIIGRNGAGKTCLAQALMGQLQATGGSVRLDGADLLPLDPAGRVRKRLALVPEGRMIFGQLTVRENLEMAAFGAGLALTPDRLKRVEDLFPILVRKRHDAAGTMSGGEQQWLALARALVQEPRAIILDEPSLGLSPVAIDSLAESLLSIRDQGVALVLMEQNPHLLEVLCDEVLLLDQGKITRSLEFGTGEGTQLVAKAFLGI